MANVGVQMDIFLAARTSGDFLRSITAALTTQNIHLQAVIAFEALGTILDATPILIDQAVLVLGGNWNVMSLNLLESLGYRRNDIATYLRKSAPCVRSFLLTTALKAALYTEDETAEILFHMLSAAGLLDKFPVAKDQLVALVRYLEPKTRSFLEDFAKCNMEILTAAAAEPDMYGLDEASQRLRPEPMAKVLKAGFGSLFKKDTDITELRGSTGFFDVATIFTWLVPSKTALSFPKTEVHPSYRPVSMGSSGSALIIQAYPDDRYYKTSIIDASPMWQIIPWSSIQKMALNAVSWAQIAKPLVGGTAGLFTGVALNAARRLIS